MEPSDYNHSASRVVEPAKILLICGPARSGKSNRAIEFAISVPRGERGLVVLPSEPTAVRILEYARHLVRNHQIGSCSERLHAVSMRDLVHEICRESPRKGHRIGASAQSLILAELSVRRSGTRVLTNDAYASSGYAAALQSAIRHLKLSACSPDAVSVAISKATAKHADVTRFQTHHAQDLVEMYGVYQEFLSSKNLYDEADEILHAIRSLSTASSRTPFGASRIAFDCFHDLTPAEIGLLKGLVNRLTRITATPIAATITIDEARPVLSASSIALRDRIQTTVPTRIENRPPQQPAANNLGKLAQSMYSSVSAPVSSAQPTSDDSVLMISAPDILSELEEIARQFTDAAKLLSTGWGSFALVTDRPEDYRYAAPAAFRPFGIPICCLHTEPLNKQPLIATVLNLMDVYVSNWKRSSVVSLLRRNTLMTNPEFACEIVAAADRHGAWSGDAVWRQIVKSHELTKDPSDWIERFLGWQQMIASFGLTSDIRGKHISDAIRKIAECSSQSKSDGVDLEPVLKRFEAVLATLTNIERSLETTPVDFEKYVVRLHRLCSEARQPQGLPNEETVLIVTPAEAQLMDIRVAAVVGQVERGKSSISATGQFLPLRVQSELTDLASFHSDDDITRANWSRFQCYLSVSAPSHQLIISYPRVMHNSDSIPSFWLDEVRNCIPPVEQVAQLGWVPSVRYGSPAKYDNRFTLTEDDLVADASTEQLCITVQELIAYAECPFSFLLKHRLGLTDRYEQRFKDAIQSGRFEEASDILWRSNSIDGSGRDKPTGMTAGHAIPPWLCPEHIPLLQRLVKREVGESIARLTEFRDRYSASRSWSSISFGQTLDQANFRNPSRNHVFSSASAAEALKLQCGPVENPFEIRIAGIIDRLDYVVCTGASGLVCIVDSDESADFGRVARGEATQLVLSMLAAEQLFGLPVAIGLSQGIPAQPNLRLVRARHASPKQFEPSVHELSQGDTIRAVTREEWDALVAAVIHSAHTISSGIESGHFIPGRIRCSSCLHPALCRTYGVGRHSQTIPNTFD